MQHGLFAVQDNTRLFASLVKNYCNRLAYDDLDLTHEELMQLSWYDGSTVHSPQASETDLADKLHIEIKRALARCYCFNLILKGNQEAYEKFIQAQDAPKLSFSAFVELAKEAQSLDEDARAAIRASCFLSVNEKMKLAVGTAGFSLTTHAEKDSEIFLSELAVILQQNKKLIPVASVLSSAQVELFLKMYWPRLHLRQLKFTEGGINMTDSYLEGLKSSTFKKADFTVWKWRWLVNLFGFINAPGAKYYNDETHALSQLVINRLLDMMDGKTDENFLDVYLADRAELAGFTAKSLPIVEQQLLAHLAAYFNQVNIVSSEKGGFVYQGYIMFKTSRDHSSLADAYHAHRQNKNAVTPTYMPAVLNNAYLVLKEKFGKHEVEAIKLSVCFTCQCLAQVYAFSPEQYISLREFSQRPNLNAVLELWLENADQLSLHLQEEGEIACSSRPSLRKGVA